MDGNPIFYKDLVSPDESILNAIEQLRTLANTYSDLSRSISEKGSIMSRELQGVNAATEQGRGSIVEYAKRVEELAAKQEAAAKKYEEITTQIKSYEASLSSLAAKQDAATKKYAETTKEITALEAAQKKLQTEQAAAAAASAKAAKAAEEESRAIRAKKAALDELLSKEINAAAITENAIKTQKDYSDTFQTLNSRLTELARLQGEYADVAANGAMSMEEQKAASSEIDRQYNAISVSLRELKAAEEEAANALNTSLNPATQQAQTIQQQFASGIQGHAANAFQGISNEIQKYTVELERLNAFQAQTTAELSKVSKEYKAGTITYDEYIQRTAELTTLKKDNAAAIKNVSDRIKHNTTLIQTQLGSYKHLSAQYSLLKMQINEIGDATKRQELEVHAKAIYEEMSRLQKATGRAQLDVGKYDLAVKDLTTTLRLISPQFGMMIGRIQQLTPLKSVWISVNNKLTASLNITARAATLLQIATVGLVVGGIYLLVKALQEQLKEQKILNDTIAKGRDDAAKDTTRLRLLYEATQNTTKSLKERKTAIEELKKAYPDYFGKLSDEEILAGEAATAYDNLADAILRAAKARAMEDAITEAVKEKTPLLEEQARLKESVEKARQTRKELQDIATDTSRSFSEQVGAQEALAAGGEITVIAMAEARLKQIEVSLAQKEKRIERLQSFINVEDLTAGGYNAKTKAEEEAAAAAKKAAEEAQKAAEKAAADKVKAAEKARRDEERAYKVRTDALRKAEDAEISLLEDTQDKREKQLEAKIKRDVEDLERMKAVGTRYNELTIEEAAYLEAALYAIKENGKTQRRQLDIQFAVENLEREKKAVDDTLKVTQEGTEEEIRLKLESLELAKKIAIEKNKLLSPDKQQDPAKLEAEQNALLLSETEKLISTRKMLIFDNEQELAQTEFDLMNKSEARKTAFRLKAEKERWEKILEINAAAVSELNKMSDTEVATIKNIIKQIDDELKKPREKKGLLQSMGLNISDEDARAAEQAVGSTISFVMGQMSELTAARVESANKAVEIANAEVSAAQSRLDKEIEARNAGYAFDLEAAERDLALKKAAEEKAIKQQKQAQKAQKAVQEAQQATSMITAVAQIWSSVGGMPFLAIPLIAVMLASYAATKIKIAKMSKQADEQYGEGGFELLTGGSHSSGNDIDLGATKRGTRRKAEGGEGLAIFSKQSTRKYGGELPQIVKALNDGNFYEKYANSYNSEGVVPFVFGQDFSTMENELGAIRQQGESKIYIDEQGRRVIQRGNYKRIVS